MKRRGFSLIEVLVVVGIIMILMAALVLGFRHVNQASARKESVTELKTCAAMATEYENNNGLAYINKIYSPGAATPPNPPTFSRIGPVGGDMGDHSSVNSPRYASGAVTNTQKIMLNIEQVPANQSVVLAIPVKRILEPPPGANPQTFAQQGKVILDGWGNPIIAVPAGGIVVNIRDPATGTNSPWCVRSSSIVPAIQPIVGSPTFPPASWGDRPFFASAGQDGDFSQGEDNVYSFQQD